MNVIENLGVARDVSVTILVDNRADMILASTETVKRFSQHPLLAEHGFAALIDLPAAGRRILWDAGGTRISLLENARRMQIDLGTVDTIALSHGHWDHTAGVGQVLDLIDANPKPRDWPPEATIEAMQAHAALRTVPLVAHPAAFRERWRKNKDGGSYGPIAPPPRAAWEAAGARLILSEGPTRLAPGCWTTGYVPRRSFEQTGRGSSVVYRDGGQFLPDDVEEDQSILIHLENKGLVVLSGCAHAGIVNTVEQARALSGVERVHAVLGGFHLARAGQDEIDRTVEAVNSWKPALVCPCHCTGFAAAAAFAAAMPQAFVVGAVGTEFLF